MVISNRERVGRALDSLREGLYPFIEREMKANYGDDKWSAAALSCLSESYTAHNTKEIDLSEDVSVLLTIMWERWNDVFRKTLGRSERSLVSELKDTRNNWAHNKPLKTSQEWNQSFKQ